MKRLIDLLFPPRCIFCRQLLPSKTGQICHGCRDKLILQERNPKPQSGAFYDKVIAALWYEKDVRTAIHRFKFRGFWHYDKPFSRLMAQALLERLEDGAQVITFVPSNSTKNRKRGYNHAQLLAVELGKQLDLPVVDMLKKRRKTQSMFGLKPEQRRANVLGAFETRKNILCEGKNIILADDILTTGSTASECARMLKMAGASHVFVCAVATPRLKIATKC